MTSFTNLLAADVVIRIADKNDHDRLVHLASLDSAAPLNGPVLFAEVEGTPKAAISLATGRSIADPFTPTADLVDLLEVRAARTRGRRRRASTRAA